MSFVNVGFATPAAVAIVGRTVTAENASARTPTGFHVALICQLLCLEVVQNAGLRALFSASRLLHKRFHRIAICFQISACPTRPLTTLEGRFRGASRRLKIGAKSCWPPVPSLPEVSLLEPPNSGGRGLTDRPSTPRWRRVQKWPPQARSPTTSPDPAGQKARPDRPIRQAQPCTGCRQSHRDPRHENRAHPSGTGNCPGCRRSELPCRPPSRATGA